MSQPLELYFWPTANGRKIAIMLEELGADYKLHLVDIRKGEQCAEAFRQISPNGRIPALVDPQGAEGAPLSIFESGAILLYLGRKFARFYPQDEQARSLVEQWLFWQVGGLGPMAGQAHHFRHYAAENIPYACDRYTQEVARLYGVMDRRLTGRAFLADDYSIADIACISWIVPHCEQGQDLKTFPHLKQWYDTVLTRPAVQRAMALAQRERAATDFAAIGVMVSS